MEPNHFKQQLWAYDQWKIDTSLAIHDLLGWLNRQGLGTADMELRFLEIIEQLKADRLIVAFVAEFSRGKTELINAIFFADYKRRLLPSDAGRTTMCPTELFYDTTEEEAYIRLLPIETRLEDASITELKRDITNWQTMPLAIDSPEAMAQTFLEVGRTKFVTIEQAKMLGLYSEELQNRLNSPDGNERIEIPVWRHALISFPHPLLKQGLVVLDTPGLNALGNEPELTINMLPSAHAVLFVLAADTGVTRSDMDMWEQHIMAAHKGGQQGLVVALNKIDVLWDDIKNPEEVANTIESQRRATAQMLNLSSQQVFPLTAQKALLAKIREDEALLQQSRLLELENYLADSVLAARQSIVRENVLGITGNFIDELRRGITAQLTATQMQLDELRVVANTNTDLIQHMVKKAREKQAAYNKKVEHFQVGRRTLTQQSQIMVSAMSMQAMDTLIQKTRQDMQESWTTLGLNKGMKTFFDGVREMVQTVSRQSGQTFAVVQTMYRKFQEEDQAFPSPKAFAVDKFNAEIERLYQEAEIFRKSPVTAATEQSFVIKKFFISLVSRVRQLITKSNHEADIWLKDVMHPLVKHVNDTRVRLEQQMNTLTKINETRDQLAENMQALEQQCATCQRQLDTLTNIQNKLQRPLPHEIMQEEQIPVRLAS